MKYEELFEGIEFKVGKTDKYGNDAEGMFDRVEYDDKAGTYSVTPGGKGVYVEANLGNFAITAGCDEDTHQVADIVVEVDPKFHRYDDCGLDDGDWRASIPYQIITGQACKNSMGEESFEYYDETGVQWFIPLKLGSIVDVLKARITEARDFCNEILGEQK